MTKEEFIVQYCIRCSWTGRKYISGADNFAEETLYYSTTLADLLEKKGLVQ